MSCRQYKLQNATCLSFFWWIHQFQSITRGINQLSFWKEHCELYGNFLSWECCFEGSRLFNWYHLVFNIELAFLKTHFLKVLVFNVIAFQLFLGHLTPTLWRMCNCVVSYEKCCLQWIFRCLILKLINLTATCALHQPSKPSRFTFIFRLNIVHK